MIFEPVSAAIRRIRPAAAAAAPAFTCPLCSAPAAHSIVTYATPTSAC